MDKLISATLGDVVNILLGFVTSFGTKLLGAIIVLVVGFILSGQITKIFAKSHLAQKMDETVMTFLKSAISIALKVVVIITAINILGVPMTSVVTVIASCGVAVGLALQGGLSNLAGGIIILIFKPFKIGDYIIGGGVEGSVEEIGIFYTTLITVDNKRVIIPNGGLMNTTVTAANQLDTRRVDFSFPVAYNSDIDTVRGVIWGEISKDERVLKDPVANIFLDKSTDSALVFTVRVWTETANYWDVYFALNEAIKKAFVANGIAAPFTQVDIHTK